MPHYPTDRRLTDRREALGRLPRGARLLGPAAAPVGRAEPGTQARRADPRPVRGGLRARERFRRRTGRAPPAAPLRRRASSRTRGTRPGAGRRCAPRSTRGLLRRRRPRLPRSTSPPSPAWSRTASAAKIRTPRPDGQGQRVRRPRVDLDGSPVQLEQEPGVERLLGEGGDDHPRRSGRRAPRAWWRTGRGSAAAPGVSPWSFIAIALASHGPIQIGRYRSRSVSLRITTCRLESMCTRTLSTTISTSPADTPPRPWPDYPTAAGSVSRAGGERRRPRTRRPMTIPATKPADMGEERDAALASPRYRRRAMRRRR